MLYPQKQLLFRSFLRDWGERFESVPFIVKYLSTYPELIAKIEDFVPSNLDSLDAAQLEWVSLVAQFDNPIETSFFKDYWIPIQKNGYDYFIDISSDKFPIFEVHYFFFEPYRWYKEYIIDDVITFLSNIDNEKFNIKAYFKKHKDESWSKVEGFFKERKDLGLSDK